MRSSGPRGDRDAPGSVAPDSSSTPAHHTHGRRRRLHRGASSVRRGRSVMRQRLVLALFAFLTLLTLAPSARAQPPAPKVTISGLFDQITSAGRNFYDGNYARDGDHEWYARTRFRPDFEFKWIYTEFDLTGKDSLLPFIPVLTVARAGGQPFATIANYKVYYANGDFAGLDLYTTFTPNVKNHLAWVDIEDTLAGGDRQANAQIRTNRGKDFAIIESP